MFESRVRSAGRNDAPLPDTFPDPSGRHPLSPAALFRLGHRVRGRRSVIFWHQLAVVRHKVALQLVKVLNRQRQEELHPAEDVQQRLRSADKNSHTSAPVGAAGGGGGEGARPAAHLVFLWLHPLRLTRFPITVDIFTFLHLCSNTTPVTTRSHDCGGGHVTVFVPSSHSAPQGRECEAEISPPLVLKDLHCL